MEINEPPFENLNSNFIFLRFSILAVFDKIRCKNMLEISCKVPIFTWRVSCVLRVNLETMKN